MNKKHMLIIFASDFRKLVFDGKADGNDNQPFINRSYLGVDEFLSYRDALCCDERCKVCESTFDHDARTWV